MVDPFKNDFIVCPHCKKKIGKKDYKVTYLVQTKNGEPTETSIIWEGCYTEEDAALTAKYFDEGFLKLIKVEEVKW